MWSADYTARSQEWLCYRKAQQVDGCEDSYLAGIKVDWLATHCHV